jgi:hypothetical protein
MFKIVNSSGNGDQEMPDWPSFADFYVDIIRPYFLVLGTVTFSVFPAVVYWLLAWKLGFGMYWIGFILLAVGLFYLPMGILCVAIYDSGEGLSPAVGIPAIVKTFPAYMVALAVLIVIVVIRFLTQFILQMIPFVGPIVGNIISFYFLIVEVRILGLLYYGYEDKLHWFEGYEIEEHEKGPDALPPRPPPAAPPQEGPPALPGSE